MGNHNNKQIFLMDQKGIYIVCCSFNTCSSSSNILWKCERVERTSVVVSLVLKKKNMHMKRPHSAFQKSEGISDSVWPCFMGIPFKKKGESAFMKRISFLEKLG